MPADAREQRENHGETAGFAEDKGHAGRIRSQAARVKRGNFDLALTEASLPVPDAVALLARWRCDAGLACEPAADALLDKARAATPAERPALLAAAEAQWLQAPPMVPLLTPLRWALVARHIEGWTANGAGSHPLGRLAVTAKP